MCNRMQLGTSSGTVGGTCPRQRCPGTTLSSTYQSTASPPDNFGTIRVVGQVREAVFVGRRAVDIGSEQLTIFRCAGVAPLALLCRRRRGDRTGGGGETKGGGGEGSWGGGGDGSWGGGGDARVGGGGGGDADWVHAPAWRLYSCPDELQEIEATTGVLAGVIVPGHSPLHRRGTTRVRSPTSS